jgi:EmrB/QacA subfamily drug resistance transporter
MLVGFFMILVDATIVAVANPTIMEELGADYDGVIWVTSAYLLAYAVPLLVAGRLGDVYGPKNLYLAGLAVFTAASLWCGLAGSIGMLIAARVVQGIGAALLTPESLALIQASFRAEDRGRVIGRWAGLGAIAAAVGPLLGGWIVGNVSWRWIFWINVPVALAVLLVTVRHVPESRDPERVPGFDVTGAALVVVGLGAVTFALIEAGAVSSGYVAGAAGLGTAALGLFLWHERRSPHPLLPLRVFGSRVFSVANAMTLLVYGGLGIMTFFLVLQLQVTSGYSPLAAGLSTVPLTVAMLLLSSWSGALATKIGPRWQMSVGPLLCGIGVFLLRGVDRTAPYFTAVLPGVVVFSLGLVALVAPLTATVLAAAPDRAAGLASGINNAVARTGSLLAVAALPALVGINGQAYLQPALFTAGYVQAMTICAGLLIAGGAVSFVGLRPG